MADLPDVGAATGAAGLLWDRAIFTSIPSPTGEGYRLVAWSRGVTPEERSELTRRAPSHGALCSEGSTSQALIQFNLQSTGRAVVGLVRLAGAEHTRRGGGRVWTDFLLADAAAAVQAGFHPEQLRQALAAQEEPKKPLGGALLEPVESVRGGNSQSGAAGDTASSGADSAMGSRTFANDPKSVACAAVAASLLLDGRSSVIAAGKTPVAVFSDAMHMIPASLRGNIQACAGLLFSPSRGVNGSVISIIDADTTRRTRGQGIECIDLEGKPPAIGGPLQPWFTLVSRWWIEGRAAEAVALADRLTGGWSNEEILGVAALCESIDREEQDAQALGELLQNRNAA